MSVNHRKKAVADTSVQYALAGRVALHFFLFICVGAIFGIINQFLLDPFCGVSENLTKFAEKSAPFTLAMVCLLPIFVRDTLKLTNRVAGPVYNLRRTVKALANGETDVPPLKFRDRDFWKDLATDFNQMTDRLRKDGAANQIARSVAANQQQTADNPAPVCEG